MERIVLRIIIIAVLTLVACNKVVIHRQINPSIGVEVKKENLVTGTTKQSDPSLSNYVKIYEDETHKNIQYGKLLINFDDYHIVSDTFNENNEIFKCEIDKGKVRPETNMMIKIQAIRKRDFRDRESIISYLDNISPSYEKIRIYSNVIDDSGIISLYSVTGGSLTNYVICYKDACYLVESDYSILDIYLFKNNPKVNYEIDKLIIKCANSFTTNVNKIIYYNGNEFEKEEYDIIQGKDGTKYFAELSYDNKEYVYNFILKNEKGKNLLTLSTHGEFYDIIKILDVNMDGYADIQFLKQAGTMNNSYDLYVWDDSAKDFIKVKCDVSLSYFEVHDGYLRNWQKGSANFGVVQKLVWKNKNTLIRESEEPYHAN